MKNSNCLSRLTINSIIFSVLLTFLVSSFSLKLEAQFTPSNDLETGLLHGVDYINPNTIWMISYSKTFISNNGGAFYDDFNSVDTTNYPNYVVLDLFLSDILGVNDSSAFIFDGDNSIYFPYGIRKCNQANGHWGLVYDANTNPEYYGRIRDMAFGENNVSIAVGENGLIVRSIDSGNTWDLVSTAPETEPHYEIEYIGNDTWIIGSYNRVLRSTDNGISWTQYSFNNQPYSYLTPDDMSFSGQTGYVATATQGFLKTLDGGETWQLIPAPFAPRYIQTIGGQIVFAADESYYGESARVYKSTNGGITWEALVLEVYANIKDMDFYNTSIGSVVTTEGVYFTNNGGGNSIPVSYFQSNQNQCLGEILEITNYTANDPSYSFEWIIDGNLVSQEYDLDYPLNSIGTHDIEFVVTNENGSHSYSSVFTVSAPPTAPQLNVTISNSNNCINTNFNVVIQDSESGTNYKFFVNGEFYAANAGNGNDLTYLTEYFTTYTTGLVMAIRTTPCDADTTTYNFDFPIYPIDPSLVVFLPNDTLCTSSQPYIGISNSSPEWSYKYSSSSTFYQGNGDTLIIPFSTSNQSLFTPTIVAKYNATGCQTTKSANSPLIRMDAISTFTVNPLAVHVNENVSLNLSSNYTHHFWEFNESASPSSYYGIPPALSYGTVGRDTINVLEIFADSSCQTSKAALINIVEDITPTPAEFCLSNTIPRSQQTLQARLDNNGNHILCGYYVQSNGIKVLFVRKENSLGELLFENTLPITGISTTGVSVATDDAQNIYLVGTAAAGYAVWGNYLSNNTFLVKFNAQGEFEWILNSSNATYLGIEVKDNEIIALCKSTYTSAQFNLDQSSGVPYPVELTHSYSGNIILFVKISAEGMINGTYLIGTGEIISNPEGNSNSNLLLTTQKLKLVDNAVYLIGATSSFNSNYNYYAGTSLIESDFEDSYGILIPSRLLIIKLDLLTNEMTGKFILESEGNTVNDFEVLENRIICLCSIGSGLFFDNSGSNNTNFIGTNYSNHLILGLDLNGSLVWKKLENTSLHTSICRKNENSAYVIATTLGLGSFLNSNTNFGYTSNGEAGSVLVTMDTNGEFSDFYSLDDESMDMVQSIVADACGNPIISKASYRSVFGTILTNYNPLTTWTTAKINMSSCDLDCSYNSINQLVDMAILDINLVPSEVDPNMADIVIELENTGALDINSIAIDVVVNGVDVFAEIPALHSVAQSITSLTLGTVDLGDLAYHHVFAQIAFVNELEGDNYSFNNTIERSQWICPGPISGDHYVGNGNSEFRTFQETAIALETCGVDGPVNFIIEPGDYYGQLRVMNFEGNSEENPITWESSTGNNSDANFFYASIGLQSQNHISTDPSVAYLRFNSISIIDSLPNSGINSFILGANSHNISIENCNFYGMLSNNTFIYSSPASKCSNIDILNNTFNKADQAIDIQGSASVIDENINVIGNSFLSQYNYIGAFTSINNLVFSSNYCLPNQIGITANSCSGILQIEKNEFVAQYSNVLTINNYVGNADDLNESIVANNIITSANTSGFSGLDLTNVTNLGVWHNTFQKAINLTGVSNISILNNIVGKQNTIVDLNGTNTNLTIDYNQYFPIVNQVPTFGTSTQSNLTFETWQQTTGYDANSIIQTPYFATLSDGHVLDYFNTGIPIPQVTLDFDNDLRSSEAPTIGADEPGIIPYQVYILSQVNPTCSQYTDGSIEVTAIQNEGEVTFTWEDGTVGNVRENLSNGIYVVTAIDELGQIANLSIPIIDPPIYDVQINLDSTCFNGTNASATLTYFNSYGNQTYVWSNGTTNSTLTNGVAGEIWVQVINGRGCIARDTTYLYSLPYQVLTNEFVQTSCPTENGGSIDVTVQGGDGNFTYLWSNGATTEDITNLAPGNYSLTVTDGEDCVTLYTKALYQPLEIEISTTTDCFVSNIGSATYDRTGGGEGFDYLWSTGSSSDTISNLSGGWYSIEVTDGTGCIAQDSILLREILWDIALDSVQIACTTDEIAAIFTSTNNENAISNISWSNGNSEFDLINVLPGEYEMIVTDTIGCTQVITAGIDEIPELVISPENVCFNGNNGQLNLVSFNDEPLSVVWNTGQNTNTISDLENGVYTVNAEYSNGCAIERSYNLNLSILEVAVENIISPICWYDNGEIEISIEGGNSPYFIIWSTNDYSQNLIDVPVGNYWVEVYDNIGCSEEIEVELTSLSQPYPFDLIGTNNAYLDSTGIFTAEIPAGSSISWQVTDALLLDSNEDSLWVEFNELGVAEIFATMTNEYGCISNYQIDVFVEEYIGVIENNNFQISTYPNPASDLLSIISNHSKPIEVRMLDSNGRLVLIKTFVNRTSLDLQNLASGNYTLIFSENGKVIDQKKVVIGN